MKLKQACEKNQDASARGYLGMSEIGHSCEAKLWLSFRMASLAKFPASALFKFEDGHISEAVTIKRIKLVPDAELDVGENGIQYGCTALNGHFRGHIDGFIYLKENDLEAVWEHKCIGEKDFERLKKSIAANDQDVLQRWNLMYYAQAQCYMTAFQKDYHLMTVASAGSRDYLQILTEYNKQAANSYYDKAERIIFSDKAPARINTSPTFPCNICNHRGVCHEGELPQVNCRTCYSSFPKYTPTLTDTDEQWFCARHRKMLSLTDQINGCSSHLYDPAVLSFYATQIDSKENTIVYERKTDFKIFSNKIENGISNSNKLPEILKNV